MSNQKSIQQLVTEKTVEILEEKLDKIVTEQANKCIEEIFRDIFRGYGAIPKMIKEEIEKQLEVSFKKIKIEPYVHRVNTIIERELSNVIEEKAIDVIKEMITESLTPITKTQWKLSEILQVFVEETFPEDEDYYNPTITLRETNYGSVVIYIDQESNVSDYKCAYTLRIGMDNHKRLWDFSFADYSKTHKPKDRDIVANINSTFETLIFGLYASRAQIEIDDYETEFYKN